MFDTFEELMKSVDELETPLERRERARQILCALIDMEVADFTLSPDASPEAAQTIAASALETKRAINRVMGWEEAPSLN